MDYYRTVNIEKGMPHAESAKILLQNHIVMAKRTGVKVLKIIHGYGSSGKGGVLRTELRKMLNGMKNTVTVIYGENFSIFDDQTRQALAQYPELRKDKDLENTNQGVTLLFLK